MTNEQQLMKTVVRTTRKLTMCGVCGLEMPTEPHCPGESDIDGETGIKIVGGNVESVFVLATVVSCVR